MIRLHGLITASRILTNVDIFLPRLRFKALSKIRFVHGTDPQKNSEIFRDYGD
jgi:hypothetical protein